MEKVAKAVLFITNSNGYGSVNIHISLRCFHASAAVIGKQHPQHFLFPRSEAGEFNSLQLPSHPLCKQDDSLALKAFLYWEIIATSNSNSLLSFTETKRKGSKSGKPGYQMFRKFPVLFTKWEVCPVSPHFGGDLEEEIIVMVTFLMLLEYSREKASI